MVFILKSPAKPLKVYSDKATLNITHTLAYVTQRIEAGENVLRSYVTMHGDGFTEVTVNLKRRMASLEVEEGLAQLKFGASAITWKPTIRNFDITLTSSTEASPRDFLEPLRRLDVEVQKGSSANLKATLSYVMAPP